MTVRSNGIPKYIQLKDILKNKIAADYRPGEKFMTEKELMREYRVSFATAAHAMKDLTQEGYFFRKRGKGTFVQEPHPADNIPTALGLPELFISGRAVLKNRVSDPLNWMVGSEIARGIINSYNGVVRMLNNGELASGLSDGKIRNLILLSPEPSLIEHAKQCGCRCVVIDHGRNYENMPGCVSWEQMFGVYKLMSWLIRSLGHQRIGLICGNGRQHRDRFAAYQIGLRTYDIPFRDELVVTTESGSEECGYAAMKKLLALKNPPTAVFADTDIKAIGAIKAAHDSRLRIPEDISIAGFDDIQEAAELAPPLTTVKAPYYEMGSAGVKMLLELMETDGRELPPKLLHTELIVRSSCGKAPR